MVFVDIKLMFTNINVRLAANHLRSSLSQSVCGWLPVTTIHCIQFVTCLYFLILLSKVNLKNELGSDGTSSFLIIKYFPGILVTQDKEQCVHKYCSYFLHVNDLPVLTCTVCFHYTCYAIGTGNSPSSSSGCATLIVMPEDMFPLQY